MCNSCGQPLHPHPACCIRVDNLTWCRPCLTATRAAWSRDADESSAQDTSSEDESSASEGEEDENDENEESEEGIDADSNGGSNDRPQQEEGAGSPDPWDNGPVTLLAPTPLSAGRPRRALSARLVDDYGLTRFVPQAEADAWSTALAATAGPGPRSTTSTCPAPQHSQGMPLFEQFFNNSPS